MAEEKPEVQPGAGAEKSPETTAYELNAFGEEQPEAPVATDPGKKPDVKPDPADSKKSEEGDKAGDAKPGDKKLYAGKYETVEAMEAAAIQAQSHIGRLTTENGELRKAAKVTTDPKAKPATTAKVGKEAEGAVTEGADDEDPDIQLLRQGMGDEYADAILRLSHKIAGKTVQPFTAEREERAKQQFVDGLAAHAPGIPREKLSEAFDSISQDLADAEGNPAKQEQILIEIMKGRLFTELLDKGVSAGISRHEAEDKARKIATGTVAGDGAPAGKGGAGNAISDKEKYALQAFGELTE